MSNTVVNPTPLQHDKSMQLKITLIQTKWWPISNLIGNLILKYKFKWHAYEIEKNYIHFSLISS